MDSAMYVAISSQIALEERLNTIAQNVANIGTAGYRAEGIKFATALEEAAAQDSTAFVSSGETYVTRHAGSLMETENPLDVAVQGDAWLAITTPAGIAYTRDGRLRMQPTGELTTLAGYPVLDVGRAPLIVDPDAGPPIITRDGMITQRGQQLGAIGLFSIDPETPVERFDNSAVIPQGQATEVLDFTDNGIVQGFVEGSNVNPIMEISRLIAVTRAFEAANSMIDQSESTAKDAIRTLGETS
jgi:flagellar basal-body rod protein FlgF